MTWEAAFRSIMINNSAVSDIVSDKVDWGVRPQRTAPPNVVINIISDSRDQNFDGFESLRPSRVQIDCYAPTRAMASDLSNAVINAITPVQTVSGISFDRAGSISVRDLGADTDTGFVHRDSIDAQIWHT